MRRSAYGLIGAGLLVVAVAAAPSTATFGGKNGRISFSRNVGASRDIFTANPDGSHKRRLTTVKSGDVSFNSEWSPDGRSIAFDITRLNPNSGEQTNIFVVPSDGGDPTRLTRGKGLHGTPGWSPSGTSLAIESDWGKRSLNGIWIIPASDAGGVTVADAQRVTDVPKGVEFDREPQFTPDGTAIVFTRFKSFRHSKSAIYRVNADGTGLERLTNYRLNASDPDVSPDGQWITFDSGDTGLPGTKGDIHVMRIDGGRKRTLTNNDRLVADGPFELAQNPAFSPNGRRILYTQFHTESSDLVVMKTNGSGKHTILGGQRLPNRADWGTHP
jgi:TolB protein